MTSVADILISLGQNMALVLSLLFVYQWLEPGVNRLGPRWERAGFGLLLGLAACGGMLVPVALTPGVLIDSSGVLVSLAGFFGGGLAAALPVCAFRLYYGGAGAWPGVFATIGAMVAGLLFARALRFEREKAGPRHLLGLGAVVAALFLLWLLPLPGGSALASVKLSLLPLAVTYPVGTLVIGSLLLSERRRRLAEAARDRGTALLRQATQAARIGVWEADLATGKIDWSDNVEALLGLPSGTFRGTRLHFLKRVERGDRALVLAKLREALAGSGEFSAEFRMKWDDGSIHWCAARGAVEQSGTRGPKRMVGVLADVSERRKGQRDLEASEASLAESQSIARLGSWIWREDGGFVWCSEEMCRLLGARKEELQGTFDSFLDRVHPDDREKVRERARHLIRSRESVELELRLIHPDGTLYHIFAIARPNTEVGGKVIDYRGICQDITKQKLAELGAREREERYRCLVEHLPICIHEIDVEGNLLAMNPAGLSILNAARPSDVCGRPYLDFMAPRDRERIRALFDRSLAGEASEFEVMAQVDGVTRIFSSSLIPLLDGDGRVYRIMGHTVDLTRERAREADLHRLGTAIEQAVVSIVITDLDAVIEYVNPAYEKITGYSRAESIGTQLSIVKGGMRDEGGYSNVWNCISSGQTWEGEFPGRRKNGDLFHQRATISPIYGAHGEIVNYVSFQHDITHEVELEKQLHQAHKMEALGTLAGGIAHDFNNILHAMLGFCHIARETGLQDPAALDRSLQEIEQGASRAAALVEQILTFSRTSDVRFSTISLPGAVEDVLRFLRGSLPPSIEIQLHAGDGAGNVFGDPTQIHQMVMNLCTNAFHAMEDRGGILRVSVGRALLDTPRQTLSGLLPEGDYNLLQIEDNGIGIDPANFDRLFDPFYTTKSVGKGTGLGLSMVHGIAIRMKGGVDIESALGEGTRVSVYLPVSLGVVAEEATPAGTRTPSRGSASVLLVDDDESITNMVSNVLQRQGFEVTTFNSPLAALEVLESSGRHFDIAICDLTMPRMNGIELSRRLRRLHPDLPILLATGVIDDEKLDVVHVSGIRDVLRKPFHINALIDAINRNL